MKPKTNVSAAVALALLALLAGGLHQPQTARAVAAAPAGWARTDPMGVDRLYGQSATRLFGPACQAPPAPDYCGKVLVAGGETVGPVGFRGHGADLLSSAELYDPVTGTWSPTGAMTDARADARAVLLPSGKVLVVGSVENGGGVGGRPGPLPATAEIYDPGTGTWAPSSTRPLAFPQLWLHTATLISGPNCGANCGKVLVVGGNLAQDKVAQLYDPVTQVWSLAAPPTEFRFSHTATLLTGPNCGANCGKILLVGGRESPGTAELFDPSLPLGTWRATNYPPMVAQSNGLAVQLGSGKVLIAGGQCPCGGNQLAPPQLFDPATETWSATGKQIGLDEEVDGSMTLLPDGKVLATALHTKTAQIYNPEALDPSTGWPGAWTKAPSTASVYERTPATLVGCGAQPSTVLVENKTSAELYDPTASSPRLQRVEPPQGAVGAETTVTLVGTGFASGQTKVRFGQAEKDPISVSPDGSRLEVVAPAASEPGTVDVSVSVNGVPADTCSREKKFLYISTPKAPPILSVADVAVKEGDRGLTPATFKLSLNVAPIAPVSVGFSITPGSATPGVDYRPRSERGTVTFPAGSLSQTVTVDVVGDTDVEPDETFFLNLSAAAGVSLERPIALGVIQNDDGVAGLSADHAPEGAGGDSGTQPGPGQPIQQQAHQQQVQGLQQPQSQPVPAQPAHQFQVQGHAQTQLQAQAQAQSQQSSQTQLMQQTQVGVQPAATMERHRQVEVQTQAADRQGAQSGMYLASSRAGRDARVPFGALGLVVLVAGLALSSPRSGLNRGRPCHNRAETGRVPGKPLPGRRARERRAA